MPPAVFIYLRISSDCCIEHKGSNWNLNVGMFWYAYSFRVCVCVCIILSNNWLKHCLIHIFESHAVGIVVALCLRWPNQWKTLFFCRLSLFLFTQVKNKSMFIFEVLNRWHRRRRFIICDNYCNVEISMDHTIYYLIYDAHIFVIMHDERGLENVRIFFKLIYIFWHKVTSIFTFWLWNWC